MSAVVIVYNMAAMEAAPEAIPADMQWIEDEPDLGPAVGGPPAAKVRVVNTEDKEAMERELNHLKMSAQTRQDLRMTMAAIFWCALIPLELAKGAIAAVKRHGEQTRGVSNHGRGPPHAQLWKTLVSDVCKALAQVAELGPTDNEALKCLQDHHKEYMQTPANFWMFIGQARVKEVKNEKAILHWSMANTLDNKVHVDRALIHALTKLGGDIRPGNAPANPLERRAQTDIEALAFRLGKGKGRGKTK